tara:strand:+ start:1566 stop:1703 length:138 start_codon:yes stop_codon:yes gene_type:complete
MNIVSRITNAPTPIIAIGEERKAEVGELSSIIIGCKSEREPPIKK